MTSHRGEGAILYMDQASVLGGAERVTLLAMRAARAAGYMPLLACPGAGRFPDTARDEGFTVLPCDFAWMESHLRPGAVISYLGGIARVGRRVGEICRRHDVRLLHPVSPVAGLYAMRAAADLRLPVLLHMHDAQPPKRPRRAAIRWQARHTTTFVCVSETVRRMVTGIGIPAHRTTVLYNALDPSFLGAPPAPADLGPGPHIGLFAQVVPWKGQQVFLDAARILADRLPDARFHVVGALAHPNDQPYLDALRAAAAAPPLTGRASIDGYQADAQGWMAAMDVVVHASTEPEAFGLVIAEGMALGKPVVATRTGGPEEIVEDGATGLLINPGDAAAMASAVECALRSPHLGAAAARSVRERFTPERFADGLLALYAATLPAR